jgi:hypothetical protein
MISRQLELIYSQYGMSYKLFPGALRSNFDKTKQKYGPHADGIVGSALNKPKYQLTNQLQ